MCIYISVTYYKMTHISEMNEPNKYRPPLSYKTRKYTTCIKFGSQHRCIEKLQVDKYTNIQDLIEIHRFHNIWSEIRKNIEEIHKTGRISEQILQNTANIANLEQI